MECLYCETELKPFRGLFDEDFCCRDHRDKYFSSFRRALNRLPALEIPPTAPMAESVSLPVHATEEPPFSADAPAIPAGTADLPLPIAAVAAQEPATGVVPAATDLVSNVAYEEIPADPPAADFLHLAVAALAGAQPVPGASLDALPVSYAIEVPSAELPWPALLEMEQRPAELLEPPQTAAATEFAPMPTPLELSAESPAITHTAPELQAAESAAHAPYLGVCGYTSLWNYTDPLTPDPLALTVASFCMQADGSAWLPTAEFAEVMLACLPLASSPVAAPEIQVSHAFCAPVFTPSKETTLVEDECHEEYEGALDQVPAADSPAPAEIAPALVMNSAPLDSPALLPAYAAQMMPPALAFSSARSSAPAPIGAPGLASTIEGQPQLAPELMADIPQAPAANQAAEPHAHAPLRHLFGSSVRIKNWRLRITFAKPA